MVKMKNKIKITVMIFLAAAGIMLIGCFVYISGGYKADMNSIVAFSAGTDVTKSVSENEYAYYSDEVKAGLVFYPGGKVESTSYEPLMRTLADRGLMCILMDMPFDLAVFDVSAAEGVKEKYPDVERWYMAGHSLGGAMAASYISENTSAYEGLILLGAYSTDDLSSSGLDVLSLYGSKDKVLDKTKYNDNIKNLPEGFTEIIIQGGNHAYFGMYGNQEGDGTAEITNEEQIIFTADTIAEFILREE